MIIKCKNQKINQLIHSASYEAAETFINVINKHATEYPDNDEGAVVMRNAIIVGAAKVLGIMIHNRVKKEFYEQGIDKIMESVKINLQAYLESLE